MLIEIPKLAPDGEWFRGQDPAEALALDGDPVVRRTGPIDYELFAQVVSGQLVVRGTVTAAVGADCARCTDFCSTTISVSAFLRDYELTGTTTVVDITADLREEIILNMPHYPLCRPDCRGLCPECGANRNREACACSGPAGHPAWGTLDGL